MKVKDFALGIAGVLAVFSIGFPFDRRLGVIDNTIQLFFSAVFTFWARQPPASQSELMRLRQFFHLMTYIPIPSELESREVLVPGGDKGRDIPVLLLSPKDPPAPLPLVVYFHSEINGDPFIVEGGFVIGEHREPLIYDFASIGEALFASVSYSLAPENKFPAGVKDCWVAFLWLRENAASLGADPNNVLVAGASAGGNLAAAVALKARAAGITLSGQVLMVPMLRFGAQTKSHQEFGGLSGLTTEAIVYYWNAYVNSRDDCESELCQPVVAKNLSASSPALVVVGLQDVLRDEGIEYYEQLKASGVDTKLLKIEGTHTKGLAMPWVRREIALEIKQLAANRGFSSP